MANSKIKQNNIELVDTSSTQAVSNKDIDGGTASNSNRITLPKNTTANLNALTRKEATLVYDTTTQTVKYDDGTQLVEVGSGGGGGADTDLSNLTSPTAINQDLLPDADSTRDLGASGNAFDNAYINNIEAENITVANDPIADQEVATKKYVDEKQWDGEILPFVTEWETKILTTQGFGTLQNQDFKVSRLGSNLLIRGRFQAGTVAASEARIYLPDSLRVSSIVSTLQRVGMVNSSVSNSSFFGQSPLTALGGNDYITFGAATSTQNFTINVLGSAFGNNVIFTVQAIIPIEGWTAGFTTAIVPFSSDPESYVPQTQGFSWSGTPQFYFSREGAHLIIWGRGNDTSRTSAENRIYLPNNLVIANTISNPTVVGNSFSPWTGNAGWANHSFMIARPGNSWISMAAQSTTSLTEGTASGTLNGTVSFMVRVPIQGWTTGFPTAASVGQNLPATFRAYKNGGTGSANVTIPNWTAKDDPRGMFNLSTGEATIPDTGWYDINGSIQNSDGASRTVLNIYVNGTQAKPGIGGSSLLEFREVNWRAYLTKGDLVTLRPSANINIALNNTATQFSISKINTPQALMNIRKIALLWEEYAPGTNVASYTTFTDRVLNSIKDPYGIVSLNSNHFTLQPGRYRIKASVPGYNTNYHQALLYNVTASSNVKPGSSLTSNNNTQTSSVVEDIVTITSATTYSIRHRASSANTAGGGAGASFGVNVIFTQVEIEKLD